MSIDVKQKLSPNFILYEFLRSDTAERQDELQKAQMNPSVDVVENLRYLCETTLQPIRERFNYPFRITSGFRSTALNKAVGGSLTSQHSLGQASDIIVSEGFLTDERTVVIRDSIKRDVLEKTGKPLREDINANFYLFAFVCLNLDVFDIDQVIHEYGKGYGNPAWVHLSASTTQDKRQILALGKYVKKKKNKLPTLEVALGFGT